MVRHRGPNRWEKFCDCSGDDDRRPSPEECRRAWREHVHQHLGMDPHDHWFFAGRRFLSWLAAGGPGHANPWVGLVLSKGGGLLPLLVLHLVSQGFLYGNDIMRELEERSRGTWASNPGAIYPLLRLLERQGLLRGEWENPSKRTRRMYRLTDQGREECVHLKDLMRPGLQEALGVMEALYDELYPESDMKNGEPTRSSGRD